MTALAPRRRLEPPRAAILNQIAHQMAQVIQWEERRDPEWCELAAEHYRRAVTLIELLEVTDCGSVGGFDFGQREGDRTFFARFDWLVRKYDAPSVIEKTHRGGFAELRDYFTRGPL